SKGREKTNSEKHTLHEQVKLIIKERIEKKNNLKKENDLKEDIDKDDDDSKDFNDVKDGEDSNDVEYNKDVENVNDVSDIDFNNVEDLLDIQQKIINSAEVVTCTCVTAGQFLLCGFNFPFVLIDEAVQCIEPATVIPLTYGAEKLILVGDQKQLGPTILNKDVENAGLNISMFERLLSIGLKPYLLSVQYRMHPQIADWPNKVFYEGKLENGISDFDRISIFKNPTFFHACYGQEQVGSSGISFLNQSETDFVLQI
ncbi:Regulator of nonsense transcripts 1, partial [Dictyocoela muelleri]